MQTQNIIIHVIPAIIVLVIFWLVLIYPNSVKERKEKEKAFAAAKGDRIVTRGGVEGVVTEVRDETVLIQSEKSVLEIRREYIAEIL